MEMESKVLILAHKINIFAYIVLVSIYLISQPALAQEPTAKEKLRSNIKISYDTAQIILKYDKRTIEFIKKTKSITGEKNKKFYFIFTHLVDMSLYTSLKKLTPKHISQIKTALTDSSVRSQLNQEQVFIFIYLEMTVDKAFAHTSKEMGKIYERDKSMIEIVEPISKLFAEIAPISHELFMHIITSNKLIDSMLDSVFK